MKARSKSKKVSKIKTIRPAISEQELKPIDERGYPIPRSEICCEHGEQFWLTFSFSRKNYCLKNSIFYWTKNEKDKEKWICSPCLKSICLNLDKRKEFLKTIENSKKGHLRSYLSRNII